LAPPLLPPLVHRFHANEIFHRIRLEPRISQRDIVARTGFDKSTVSSIVNRFDELGLIVRSPNGPENRPGRPTEGLSISPDSGLLVGVQVEADALAFIVSGLDGVPLEATRHSFDGALAGLETTIALGIRRILAASSRSDRVLGIGVSLPGLVNSMGVLVHAPVFGWRDVPILSLLGQTIQSPLFIGNDGKAAAMAEHMFGSCVDVKDFLYLFSGSGVGGAIVIDGQIHRGANGLAGEFGHIKVVPHGRLCSCGAMGCLSAYLSESALTAEINHLTASSVRTFAEVLDRAERGDEVVLDVLDEAAEVLGSALASLINVFNTPLIVLGGDTSRASRFLKPGLMRSLRRLAHPAMYAQSDIRFSQLSAAKPYLGGIALALDGVTGLDAARVIP
jgi:predicted NBD/HSP70 family sugar kinase